MDAERLNDRVARGLGQAAARIGESYETFRPSGAFNPLSRSNLLLRLNVGMHQQDRDWSRTARYGGAEWLAVHDTAYTRRGDYLCGPAGIFFIASQPPLLPTLCVLTNRVLRLARPDGASQAGTNGYGGVDEPQETVLLDAWPASVLLSGAVNRATGALPGEPGPARWTVLLPALGQPDAVGLQPGDLMTDETGARSVISAVERTDLGWRLTATEAVT
ncbi:MAG: hypothetical protein HIU92_17775 [Proteobacteria bacterium]|nr:hypothetical protein [Pseudomonadota bacterium]